MKLEFIPLDKLVVSKANMRYGKRAPDVSDILPTVRKRGVIQPVIVRPNPFPLAIEAADDAQDVAGSSAAETGRGFEIIAGSRRFHAARIVAEERVAGGGESDPLPCAILDDGDDADAVEASLIENLARLDPDEVTQWATFTRLVKEGRTPDDIAATFGLPALVVKRVLALGSLLPRIRAMYAREDIDVATRPAPDPRQQASAARLAGALRRPRPARAYRPATESVAVGWAVDPGQRRAVRR